MTFSSQLLEPYRTEIEARAGRRLDVIANKSIHGLVALLEGRARMAMISSELEGELGVLRRIRPDLPAERLQSFAISRTRIAFIAHRSNPVSSATLDQIAGILAGSITNWRQIGGNDLPITVVTVQPGGGVPTTARGRLLGGRAMTPGKLIVVEAPRHVVTITAQLEGALGIAQVGLVGIAPVHEIVTDRKVEQQLNLVTLGPPDPDLAAIIEAAREIASEKLY
jgi:ABC-type phosphate transport system substrate-binding protein